MIWTDFFQRFRQSLSDQQPRHTQCDFFGPIMQRPIHFIASVSIETKIMSSCDGNHTAPPDAALEKLVGLNVQEFGSRKVRCLTLVLYEYSREIEAFAEIPGVRRELARKPCCVSSWG